MVLYRQYRSLSLKICEKLLTRLVGSDARLVDIVIVAQLSDLVAYLVVLACHRGAIVIVTYLDDSIVVAHLRVIVAHLVGIAPHHSDLIIAVNHSGGTAIVDNTAYYATRCPILDNKLC